MKCYKITITENKYNISSSRSLMLRVMRDALKDLHRSPNGELGVMYRETDTYPKDYYFKTSNNAFLSKIIAFCKAQEVNCPPYSGKENSDVQFLGNKIFFTDKERP